MIFSAKLVFLPGNFYISFTLTILQFWHSWNCDLLTAIGFILSRYFGTYCAAEDRLALQPNPFLMATRHRRNRFVCMFSRPTKRPTVWGIKH